MEKKDLKDTVKLLSIDLSFASLMNLILATYLKSTSLKHIVYDL